MKVAVIGLGLMGPTLAMDCLSSDDVDQILLIDIDEERLNKVAKDFGNPSHLKMAVQDVRDTERLSLKLKGYDVALIALLRPYNIKAIEGAIRARVHTVDISGPTEKEAKELDLAAKKEGVMIVPGCGVEPGLTEILASYGMDKLDTVNSVDFYCGGIPQDPQPPLDYKIVFGGPYLPLRPENVKVIEDGEERMVKRYSLGEPIKFQGIERKLECFYDGFPDTLYEIDKFRDVKHCAEKTVRYAGYCDKVNFLDELGLLSRKPIDYKGQKINPFEMFSKIVHPKVKLEEGEKDITVLRVVVEGVKDGAKTTYTFNMVDYFDDDKGITSMAKTTCYTAAIVGRMLGRNEIKGKGLITPCKLIRGKTFEILLSELASRGVNIIRDVERVT
jgi:lysine 6-dehydrogenase